MRFALAGVTSALEAAGLLVAVRGALPEFVESIADDSREVVASSARLSAASRAARAARNTTFVTGAAISPP